jgi:hypothetical protein
MNKQSSIDWLFEQVWINPVSKLPEILEQAKAMHKEEVINFSYKILNESNNILTGYVDEEKIYEQTFGGDNE